MPWLPLGSRHERTRTVILPGHSLPRQSCAFSRTTARRQSLTGYRWRTATPQLVLVDRLYPSDASGRWDVPVDSREPARYYPGNGRSPRRGIPAAPAAGRFIAPAGTPLPRPETTNDQRLHGEVAG